MRDDDKGEVKQAPFRQTNAADNPIDENGKTARDREIEAAKGAAGSPAVGSDDLEAQREAERKAAEKLEDEQIEARNRQNIAGGEPVRGQFD